MFEDIYIAPCGSVESGLATAHVHAALCDSCQAALASYRAKVEDRPLPNVRLTRRGRVVTWTLLSAAAVTAGYLWPFVITR